MNYGEYIYGTRISSDLAKSSTDVSRASITACRAAYPVAFPSSRFRPQAFLPSPIPHLPPPIPHLPPPIPRSLSFLSLLNSSPRPHLLVVAVTPTPISATPPTPPSPPPRPPTPPSCPHREDLPRLLHGLRQHRCLPLFPVLHARVVLHAIAARSIALYRSPPHCIAIFRNLTSSFLPSPTFPSPPPSHLPPTPPCSPPPLPTSHLPPSVPFLLHLADRSSASCSPKRRLAWRLAGLSAMLAG
ncbi:unnamed protein product [Closterium sp. Naga37s-1]|nr:unnamed protein product [Closterium sp. Naga37s-1]